MVNKRFKPGCGWKRLPGPDHSPLSPVYEHPSGARIHTSGLISLPNQDFVYLNNLNDGKLGRLIVRINGGNIKRGLMAWVNTMLCSTKRPTDLKDDQ